MPANEYAFPDLRSDYRSRGQCELLFLFAGCGRKSPATADYEQVTDKAALVKALNDSLAYCDRVYAATTDANFIQPMQIAHVVGTGSTGTVRGAVLMYNIAHNKGPCSALNSSGPAAKELVAPGT
jgi:hypothetical protein